MRIKVDNLIIGAGIAGLAVSRELKKEGINSLVVEKESKPGGLCKSFSMGGEWYDMGGHISFTKDSYVRDIFEEGVKYHSSEAIGMNYKKGKWIQHPVQNNLAVLDTEEKIKIISDFVNKPHFEYIENYQQWLESKYGKYFSDNYPRLYTRKYWTVEPEMLETSWIGVRMYTPTLEEVLYGAFETDVPYLHYSGSSRYPLSGGFEHFISRLEDDATIKCGKTIKKILTKEKIVVFEDEEIEYENLVITAPLPEIVPLIEGVPEDVMGSLTQLDATSLVLVSLCLDKELDMRGAYIYDEEISVTRMYCTTKFTGTFTKYSALQAEVYYSKYKPLNEDLDTVKDRAISDLIKMGIFKRDEIVDVDVRYIPYANVTFTKPIHACRKTVHDYLDSLGIFYAGRFADWDYLWTDQTILSGKRTADRIIDFKNK